MLVAIYSTEGENPSLCRSAQRPLNFGMQFFYWNEWKDNDFFHWKKKIVEGILPTRIIHKLKTKTNDIPRPITNQRHK